MLCLLQSDMVTAHGTAAAIAGLLLRITAVEDRNAEQVQQLQGQIEERDAKIETLSTWIRELSQRGSMDFPKTEPISEDERGIVRPNQDIEQRLAELHLKTELLKATKQNKSDAEAEKKRTGTELDRLTKAIEDLCVGVGQLRRQLDSLNQCQSETGKTIDILTRDGQYFGEQVSAAETTMVSIEGDLEHLGTKSTRHQRTIADLIADVRNLQQQVQSQRPLGPFYPTAAPPPPPAPPMYYGPYGSPLVPYPGYGRGR